MKRILPLLLPILVLAACSSAGATPASSGSAPPRPVASAEDAAARVIEVHPGLEGVGPQQANVIGACCWWTASETADGYSVTFQVGWGDCPSGCINRHNWTFAVTTDGAVTMVGETGPKVPPGTPGADLDSGAGGGILPGGSGVQGHVVAGPTCPVEKPNDPACADRPMAGVTIVILTAAGNEAARTTTDAHGFYAFTLPPGPYTIEPQPVEGMVRGSPPLPVVVGEGVTTLDIPYDTGIR
jgi:carboxypeptidase family protein